ncbi:molybdenum cofactor biosynthesis protein MoaE [Fulvivirgaceae bacterium BMA12]|uniref:Molybdopterin synthase catalytic subunit n=1 Tax=Agaribacillus aureus TaxID=3051825 RepID=A0ABT8LJG2_9BACT|nr:molybdenum cofactor biosynthesis protein MoaE [Fulvivirgaceae bacterium BMA12]
MIKLTKDPIQVDEVINSVYDDGAGAVDVFIGSVRNKTEKKKVVKLIFEAYEKMAISEMEKIAKKTMEKWPVCKLSIVHRIGTLNLGELPVVIAVSTPHRSDAFAACRFIIDTLKETVPIWKKEIFEDGEVWVAAHP